MASPLHTQAEAEPGLGQPISRRSISRKKLDIYVPELYAAAAAYAYNFGLEFGGAAHDFSDDELIPAAPRPSDAPRPSYNGYIATLRSCVAARALCPGQQLHARLRLRTRPRRGPRHKARRPLRVLPPGAKRAAPVRRNGPAERAHPDGRAGRPCEEAIGMYRGMLEQGVELDSFTYPPVFKACAALLDLGAIRYLISVQIVFYSC
jgi:pentatricopeptide repeat protein